MASQAQQTTIALEEAAANGTIWHPDFTGEEYANLWDGDYTQEDLEEIATAFEEFKEENPEYFAYKAIESEDHAHYFVKNGTELHFTNSSDFNNNSEFIDTIEICSTEKEFTKWCEGEGYACKFDSEFYVKIWSKTEDGQRHEIEHMTLEEADEVINDKDSMFYHAR